MRSMISVAAVELPDVQGAADDRGIAIDYAGIDALSLPATVVDLGDVQAHTIITASAAVSVRANERGTHMSRLVDALLELDGELILANLPRLHRRLIDRCSADEARLRVEFPWFIAKAAPISGVRSLLDIRVRYSITGGSRHGIRRRQYLCVPVTTLCPCSKTISEYGAHNQRAEVSLDLEVATWLPIRHLVGVIERQASCEIFGLLKRADEKYVTERAYENPKFVEDVVRDLHLQLDSEPLIQRSRIRVASYESIHNHQAFASIGDWTEAELP